jgi:hypothetical protein
MTTDCKIPTLDSVATRTLDQAVRFYGVRAVLNALAGIADGRAEKSVENFNTVQSKQWAAWSVALEALADDRKLTDPGRQ